MSLDEFWNGDPAPEPLEVSMSTDALAALLVDAQRVAMNMSHKERKARWGDYGSFYFNRPLSDAEFRALADIASERGVVVLPADHPLRTGEPSEALVDAIADHLATMFAWGAEAAVKPLLREAAANIGRAALAVLRV